MIFVFDGVDGIGKSTLIDKAINTFKKEDGFDVYLHQHKGPDENGLFRHDFGTKMQPFNYFYSTLVKCEEQAIRSFKTGRFPIFFFDRFFISNLVYGYMFENQQILKDYEIYQLLFKLHKFCWCFILVTVDGKYTKIIFKRRLNKDEIGEDKDNGLFFLNELNNIYVGLFKKIKVDIEFALMAKNVTLSNEQNNLFNGDKSKDNFINFIKNIYVKMLQSRKSIDKFFLKNYESTGNLNGKIAFVGEKVNLKNNRGYIDPFIGGCGKPFYATMAKFFKHRSYTHLVYITNAIKINGSTITKDELKDFEIIVPLGKKAEDIILNLNLKKSILLPGVYHPQYVNRFMYYNFKSYYDVIFKQLLVYVDKYQKQLNSQLTEYNLEGDQKNDAFKR